MAHIAAMILRNIISLTTTHVAGRIIRFLYMLAIARLLGPEGTGVYLYGIALYLSVFAIGLFAQDVFLSQRVGKHAGTPNSVLHHSLTLSLSATSVVTVLLILFVWLSETDPALRLAILCLVGAMASRIAAHWVRSAYVAFERPGWVPKYEAIFRGSEAIVGVTVLLSGGGLLAICFLHFLFWSIEAVFALRKLAREHPGVLGLGRNWKYLKKACPVSVAFLGSVAALFLFSQIAIVLLRKLQPDGVFVGHFGIAMQFMTTMLIVPGAATQAFLPRLSRSYARGGGGGDVITAVKLVGLLALAASIAAAAYGPWFISVALGSDYAEAGDLFRWLCWVFTPYAIMILLCQCFTVIAARGTAAIIAIGVTVIHAGLLIILLEQSPTIAAVGSMAVAAIAGMIAALYQVTRKLGLQGHQWWMKSVVVIAASYAVFESAWAPLMITAPVALAVGAVLIWQLRIFDATDVDGIRRLLGRPTSQS